MNAAPLLALLALPCGASQAPPPADALVIHRVAVVEPEADRILEERTVVVAGDRIVSVEPSEGARLPAGARVVDGEGRFLMAGLADMHVHLTDPRDGLLYVASGVTTIRNLSGQPYHLDLAEAYLRGQWIGPTLRTSGPQVRLAADATPAEARAVVEEHRRRGYASVKLYGRTSRACYEAMAAASRELGMPIVGHVPRNLTLEDVVEVGGHREISHAEEMLYAFFDRRSLPPGEVPRESIEECAGLLAEAGVHVTPTIGVYAGIVPQVVDLDGVLARPEMRVVPPLGRLLFGPGLNKYTSFDDGDVVRIQRGTGRILALTGFLDEVGVPLLLGTDAMNPSVVPGTSIVDELASLVEAGLSPARALVAGTATPAEFWGESAEFGRVRPGLRADLVLLEANPLDDVRNVERPAAVVLRGRFLARDELDRLLDEQVAGYEAEAGPVRRLARDDPSACLAAIDPDRPPPEAFFLSLASVYELIGNSDAVASVVGRALELYPDSRLLRSFRG